MDFMTETKQSNVTVKVVSGLEDVDRAMQVRYAVFVKEMGFEPYQVFGVQDLEAEHVLAEDGDGLAVGSAQIFHGPGEDSIAGLAVLNGQRKLGTGSAIMKLLLARSSAPRLQMQCPLDKVSFVRGFGFEPEGEAFLLGVLEQQKMVMIKPTS